MFTDKSDKIKQNYFCKNCNYNTFDKRDYNKHLLTAKHKNNTFVDISFTDFSKKSEIKESLIFTCNCGKIYKSRQGLYSHKKKCNIIKEETTNVTVNESNDELKNLVCKLITENNEIKNTIIKENQELRAQVNELIPKVGNNNKTLNQKFNIQVFLNEKCKDAINMSDFVKSIEVSLEQLDFIKKKGLTQGLSNAIVENMNKLSIYQRPMHCTDVKRETLYIKDENKWNKNKSREKIEDAIKKTSTKNYNALQKWKNINPDFLENEKKQDYFTKTVSVIGKSTLDVNDKIIKNLCKETYIKPYN